MGTRLTEISNGAPALLLARLRRQMLTSRGRVERSATTASVHDLRMNVRCLQTYLRTLRHHLKHKQYKVLHTALSDLFRATGPAREARVRLRIAVRLTSTEPACNHSSGQLFLPRMRHDVQAATARLCRYTRTRRWAEACAHLDQGLGSARLTRIPVSTSQRCGLQHYERVLTAIRRCLKPTLKLDAGIHRLRKQLREAGELQQMGCPRGRRNPRLLNRRLNMMQAALGELHDTMQFAAWAREVRFTRKMRTAVSRNIGRLAARQLAACVKHQGILLTLLALASRPG